MRSRILLLVPLLLAAFASTALLLLPTYQEVSSNEALLARLQMLKDLAGERFGDLDIAIAYTDRSVYDLSTDVERHRDALGAYRELGATWVAVPGPTEAHPKAQEFIEGFAQTYIGS